LLFLTQLFTLPILVPFLQLNITKNKYLDWPFEYEISILKVFILFMNNLFVNEFMFIDLLVNLPNLMDRFKLFEYTDRLYKLHHFVSILLQIHFYYFVILSPINHYNCAILNTFELIEIPYLIFLFSNRIQTTQKIILINHKLILSNRMVIRIPNSFYQTWPCLKLVHSHTFKFILLSTILFLLTIFSLCLAAAHLLLQLYISVSFGLFFHHI